MFVKFDSAIAIGYINGCMKNAIIIQGAGETQKSFWLPYVKKELEKRGFSVRLPQLPGNENPNIEKTLPFILKNGTFTKETIIIAHSAGCPLALAVIQNLKIKIKQAILVAGYWRELPPPGANNALPQRYDFSKIRKNVEDIVSINSDNDPWGCDDKQGKEMFDRLGGTLILKHEEGHMGSEKFHQPYITFPLLLTLVDNKLWGSN